MTEANCYKWNYVLIGPSIRVSFNHKQFLSHKTNFRLWWWKFPLYRVCKWKFTGSTSLSFLLTCLKKDFAVWCKYHVMNLKNTYIKAWSKISLLIKKWSRESHIFDLYNTLFNTNTISTTKSIIICTKQSSWVLYPSIVYNVSP